MSGILGSAALHVSLGCLGGIAGRRCADREEPLLRRPVAQDKRGTQANPTTLTRPFSVHSATASAEKHDADEVSVWKQDQGCHVTAIPQL